MRKNILLLVIVTLCNFSFATSSRVLYVHNLTTNNIYLWHGTEYWDLLPVGESKLQGFDDLFGFPSANSDWWVQDDQFQFNTEVNYTYVTLDDISNLNDFHLNIYYEFSSALELEADLHPGVVNNQDYYLRVFFASFIVFTSMVGFAFVIKIMRQIGRTSDDF